MKHEPIQSMEDYLTDLSNRRMSISLVGAIRAYNRYKKNEETKHEKEVDEVVSLLVVSTGGEAESIKSYVKKHNAPKEVLLRIFTKFNLPALAYMKSVANPAVEVGMENYNLRQLDSRLKETGYKMPYYERPEIKSLYEELLESEKDISVSEFLEKYKEKKEELAYWSSGKTSESHIYNKKLKEQMRTALMQDLNDSGFAASPELVKRLVGRATSHGNLEEQMTTLIKLHDAMVSFWSVVRRKEFK